MGVRAGCAHEAGSASWKRVLVRMRPRRAGAGWARERTGHESGLGGRRGSECAHECVRVRAEVRARAGGAHGGWTRDATVEQLLAGGKDLNSIKTYIYGALWPLQ